jgi:hypothetical protein
MQSECHSWLCKELFFQRFKESDVAELAAVLLAVFADIPSAVTEGVKASAAPFEE